MKNSFARPSQLLAGASFIAIMVAASVPASADPVTWSATPVDSNYANGANWNSGAPPSGQGYFGASTITSLTNAQGMSLGGWTLNADAGAYTLANNGNLTITGAGIVINGGSLNITNNFEMTFENSSSAGSATINNVNALFFFGNSSAGNATINNGGSPYIQFLFDGFSTAGNAIINNSYYVFFAGNATGGNAQINNLLSTSVADFSQTSGLLGDNKISVGSLSGAGRFFLGSEQLSVGGNNLSTTVTGVISDCGATGYDCNGFGSGGSLVKVGTGTLTLSGVNLYTGATTVDGGTLNVNGDITASSGVTVNAGGTLGGSGTVGNTTINGGTLAPGGASGLLNVAGNLTFTSASTYAVDVSPASAARVNVSGAATLSGAAVSASFASGSYIAKQYTILNATGGVNGTFGTLVNTNLPSNFASSLSYDANTAYLNLTLSYSEPSFGNGLSQNQSAVGNTLTNYFNRNGGIPAAFGALTPAGLTQASGETNVGGQQPAFTAATQFAGTLSDPTMAGRGANVGSTMGYAEEGDDQLAYASDGRKRSGSERDAYAMMTKAAPRMPSFVPHWSSWVSGFGGTQTTDGNAANGTNTSTSRIGGAAVGADYWLSPQTVAGFAAAGGASSFTVAGGGSGWSDLFQVGGFVRHEIGTSYITATAAYGWQSVTTNRTVGTEQLRAQFDTNSYTARLEGGDRFVTPWLGGIALTPYAAAQLVYLDLPAYAETAPTGTSSFALAYASQGIALPRTELGLRSDKSFDVKDAVLTLRGRAAWAHDYNTDRSASATFQSLPGASFVVSGATPAADAALTTAEAELRFASGISVGATFDGEFSDVTRSYAGKGVVRYAW